MSKTVNTNTQQKALISSVARTLAGKEGQNEGVIASLSGVTPSLLGKYAYNQESLQGNEREVAGSAFEKLMESVKHSLTSLRDNQNLKAKDDLRDNVINQEQYDKLIHNAVITDFQIEAAQAAAAMAVAPREYVNGLAKSFSSAVTTDASTFVTNAEALNGGISTDDLIQSYNQEAFEAQALDTIFYASVALAVATAKQDDFADAFYPAILLPATDAFYELAIDIDYFTSDYKHLLAAGKKDLDGKLPLWKNIFNNELLDDNKLVIKPVEANDTTGDYLLKDAKFDVDVRGEHYESAPYLFGKESDILMLCNTSGEVRSSNVRDWTDRLDRAISLKNVYLGFTNAASDKLYYRINMDNRARTIFNTVPEGTNLELEVSYAGEVTLHSKNAKDFRDKSPGTNTVFGATIAALPDKYAVTISFTVHGRVSVDTAGIELIASEVKLVEILKLKDPATPGSVDEVITDLTTGVGQQIKAEVEKLKLVGYDLNTSVTNSNFRHRGLMVTRINQKVRAYCEFRSGLVISGPHYNLFGGVNDAMATTVETQSHVINSMMSVGAVKSLTGFATTLRGAHESFGLNRFQTKTIATHMVYPWYSYTELDLKTIVDSLVSTDKRDNIAAAIWNKIADTVTIMANQSNYGILYKKLYRNSNMTVVIGTDPYIAMYLGRSLQDGQHGSVTSGVFPLTHEIDAKIVTTFNELMNNRIIISFVVNNDPERNKTPNPLTFGYSLYTPPFTREVAVVRNNSHFKELHIDPRFSFINNLPIMAEFTVKGIKEALEKNVFNHHLVP